MSAVYKAQECKFHANKIAVCTSGLEVSSLAVPCDSRRAVVDRKLRRGAGCGMSSSVMRIVAELVREAPG